MGSTIRRFLICLVVAGGSLIPFQSAFATHIRAGEITITRKSCSSLDFIITITVYTNTGSPIRFSNGGVGELNFGDGSPIHHPPQQENNPVPGFGSEYGYVSYSYPHTFQAAGQYTISYFEHNRNAGILNMFNSVETPFYIETVINIDPFLGCDNSPRLLVPPIDKACSGAEWYHNPGAYDPDGDSISFEMTIPRQTVDQTVNDYRDPNICEFYSNVGIDCSIGNSTGDGPPTFKIDPVTGTITWDAPGAKGEYNIAFIIKEWRKVGGNWVVLGFVTRDMQIEVDDCENKRPEVIVPADICVDAGTLIQKKIYGTDPDLDNVKLEAYSQVFTITPSPATFQPTPAVFQPTSDSAATATFTWQTECAHVKEQPYQVVFKITDAPQPNKGNALVQFKTWNITVVGPAPTWKSASVIPGQRKASLKWKKYVCGNAESIQVWRRIDSAPYVPAQCVTGMPDFLGYTQINLLSVQDTTYSDNNGGIGLAQGASYCYRLVAVFAQPQGGLSYVSQEICLPPILADAPIVVNVTVDTTNQVDGQVTVRWRPPFDASPLQFPPPYQYKVYRAEGFSGTIKLDTLFPGMRPDTVWVDTQIDTKETVYNYRIVAFDANADMIDTSATASTVRLEVKPSLKEIELNWNATVPWSNRTVQNPRHLIFRGPENSKESDLVLIDSVDVNDKSFHYVDSGQYLSTPLKESDIYCYRVLTRGGYGNPKIAEPLLNYSQIICAQPNDTVPPCKPVLAIKAVSCKDYLASNPSCNPNSFSNTLSWNRPKDEVCRSETKTYNIYIASQVGGAFELYAQNVKDTFFIDTNLPSFARCYKISAVSRSNIESELSDSYCFDNCPTYGLPNVFTPNGDKCNELFSAYSDRYSVIHGTNSDDCGPISDDRVALCARFVNSVNFTVYNRWGKSVFTYQSGGERSIYIDWNGKDDNGAEVAAGIYFYIAHVNFNVVDPGKQNQTIKGWVQVIRGNQQ